MRWLVTGSAGFIGKRLVDSLMDPVSCDALTGCLAQGIEVPNSVRIIAHLAAISGIDACRQAGYDAVVDNMYTTQELLNQSNGRRFLFASSAAAATPEKSLYAATKAASEHLIQAYRNEYGLKAGILRLGNVYGPRSLSKDSCIAAFCKQALTCGRIRVEGTGKQRRQFVHVDDVVKAFQNMPEGLWAVHPYEETEINIVAEMVANLSGADIVHVEARPNDIKRPTNRADVLPIDYIGLWTGIQETWDYFVRVSERT